MHPLRPALASETDSLVELLCRAFADDPIVNWIVRRDAQREAGLRAFFRMWVALRAPMPGQVVTSEGCRGVMLWMPSEDVQPTLSQQFGVAAEFLRYAGLTRVPALLRFFSAAERAHPHHPHVYVQFIATDDSTRGTGLAFAFLQHAIDIADAHARPLYAETSNPMNLPIWARAGLVESGTLQLGSGAPRVWQLTRPCSGDSSVADS